MTTEASPPSSRTKGRGFPVLSLPAAAELVATLSRYGMQHSREAVLAHLGHTSDSGPFRQKLAALRDFGLVDSGSATIALTELGKRLAVPSGGDDRAWYRQAFMNVQLFEEMYDAAAKGVALSPQSLGATAFHNHGVASKSRDQFVESFIDSAIIAGLAEFRGSDVLLLEREVPNAGPESVQEPADGPSAPSKMPRRAPRDLGTAMSIARPLADGELVLSITTSATLTPDQFALLGEAMAAAERLAAALAETATNHEEG